MKIEITFTINDLRKILAEHCRKQFKVDPKNVDIESAEPGGNIIYIGRVEGDYRPDL